MQFGLGSYRTQFLFFLILIGLYSCTKPNTVELTKVFQPVYNGKIVEAQGYGQHNGFCSNTLLVNSDSTFITEGGCEGHSRSAIGKWYLIKDSIRLISLKRSPKNLSFNLTFSQSSNDKYVTFIILDKTHKPISNFAIQPFNKKPNYGYADGVGLFISSRNSFDYYDQFKTDSSGVLKITKNKSDSLDFTKLYPLTGKVFRIRNRDLPDTVKLIININGMPFRYDEISYDNDMINHPMHFKYINRKLIY